MPIIAEYARVVKSIFGDLTSICKYAILDLVQKTHIGHTAMTTQELQTKYNYPRPGDPQWAAYLAEAAQARAIKRPPLRSKPGRHWLWNAQMIARRVK